MGQFESFIGINFWTALFVLLNTLAVFFVAKKFLFGPVSKMIADRQAEIDGMYADAGKAKSEAEDMADEYRRKLSDAQATSDRLVKEAAQRGQVREEEIVRNAHDEAAAILTRASADAAREKQKVLNDAKNEISGLAMAIAGKVVERELNSDDQTALIDRFIDELGETV